MAKGPGKAIREMRLELGLSQEEFAHRAGIHHTYVSLIERGLKSPTVTMLAKLAKGLNTKPSKILARMEANKGHGK